MQVSNGPTIVGQSSTQVGQGPSYKGPFYIVLGQTGELGGTTPASSSQVYWRSVQITYGAQPLTAALAGSAVSAPVSPTHPEAASYTKPNIRSVDFQNFDYSSKCFGENAETVHISNGQLDNEDEQFFANKPVYGDLKGDGQEEAVVVMNCHPAQMSPNEVFSEVFIFEMSESGPKVLAHLPPSYWGNQRVGGSRVIGGQLAVDWFDMGEGAKCCPEWIVTSKFRWDGNRLVKAGESRRKNTT